MLSLLEALQFAFKHVINNRKNFHAKAEKSKKELLINDKNITPAELADIHHILKSNCSVTIEDNVITLLFKSYTSKRFHKKVKKKIGQTHLFPEL